MPGIEFVRLPAYKIQKGTMIKLTARSQGTLVASATTTPTGRRLVVLEDGREHEYRASQLVWQQVFTLG